MVQDKKQTFADKLFAASHNLLFGVAVAVRKKAFHDQKGNTGSFQTSAYGAGFSIIMFKLVARSGDFSAAVRQRGIAFVLETGNKNNDEVAKAFEFCSKKQFDGILRGINLVPKTSCRAIQIADFLVFYKRRHLHDLNRFDGKVAVPVSPYLQIVERYGPLWGMVANEMNPKPVGNIDNAPDFDDVSFWGQGAARKGQSS